MPLEPMPSQFCDHDALPEAFQPFSRLCAVIDALPPDFRCRDAVPLREAMPGVWPTVGDLRALAALLRGRVPLTLAACADLDDATLETVALTKLIARFCALEIAAAELLAEFDRFRDAKVSDLNDVYARLDGPFRAALDLSRRAVK